MVKNLSHAEEAAVAERNLAFSYAPRDRRAGLEALFALDARLASILRGTREPMVGQMRLTWWYEALAALDTRPPPAEPVLAALAETVLPHGVTGAMLAGLVDGWDVLLDGAALDNDALERVAVERGERLFAAAAHLLDDDTIPVAAGQGWALADLATHLSDAATAARATALATVRLDAAMQRRWPASSRPLGALVLLARFDLAAPPIAAGSPRRTWRLLRHRLTGR